MAALGLEETNVVLERLLGSSSTLFFTVASVSGRTANVAGGRAFGQPLRFVLHSCLALGMQPTWQGIELSELSPRFVFHGCLGIDHYAANVAWRPAFATSPALFLMAVAVVGLLSLFEYGFGVWSLESGVFTAISDLVSVGLLFGF